MNKKIGLVVALALAGVGILYLVLSTLANNRIYYWTATELLEAGDNAVGANVRLGGMVEAGSVSFDKETMALDFVVTDGSQTVPVHGTGMPPQMFREGIGVIVQGTITEAGVFQSDRLLVKHDNQYKAPDDGREADVQEMMKTMEGGES